MGDLRYTLALVIAALVGSARGQDPFHKTYTVEDGLSSDQVYCAMQDRDGFVWFGTDAGVSRFDGVEFMNIGPADGLADNEVIGIHQDASGRIWFLTLNGELSYWAKGEMHNASTDAYLGSYRGRSGWATFCEDEEGRLWFGGIRGDMMRLDPQRGEALYLPADFTLRSVIRDRSGSILSISANGIQRLVNEQFVMRHAVPQGWLTNHVEQPVSANVAAIGLGSKGIYELASTGTRLVAGTEGRVDVRLHRNAMRDGRGNIWISRKDEGVDLLVPNGAGFAATDRQFRSIRVNSVYVTSEGDRWYCTANHGAFLVDRQLQGRTALFGSDRNSGSAFISIAATADGLWLGSDQGHILYLQNERLVEVFRPDKGRLPGRILRIEPDASRNVWFGTDWGLFLWNGSKKDLVMIPAMDTVNGHLNELQAAAKSVLIAADGAIWSPGIGMWKNVREAGRTVRRRVVTDQLERARIYAIAEDASGTLWVADADRLLSLHAGGVQVHLLPGTFRNARISDVIHLGGDTLAIATAGKGVLIWSRNEEIGKVTVEDGLASTMVRKLRYQGDTLWCVTAKGVSAFKLARGKIREKWTWGTREGLPTNNVYDLLADQGHVFMATALGLCVAPVRPASIDRPPPTLILAHLVINDSQIVSPTAPLVMHTSDRIRVDVHALEFANADLVEYACAIGDPELWIPCAKGLVVIDGLEEGEHRIRVRARLPDGEWCAPLIVPLMAKPPWWASRLANWAATLGGLSVLLMVLYYWSRRGLRKQIAGVRAMAVVNEERRRIAADVHDDLGADLSRVLMHARRLETVAGARDEPRVSQGIIGTIHKIDEIIWSLDPRKDTLQSTVHFIEQQARELAEAHGLRFRTHVDEMAADLHLAANHRREVLLIAREALRNVAMHARASVLRLDWRIGADGIVLVVEDDGVGIATTTVDAQRHGLSNMRERAERLGGTFVLHPVQPSGTRVEVFIPLRWNHPIG